MDFEEAKSVSTRLLIFPDGSKSTDLSKKTKTRVQVTVISAYGLNHLFLFNTVTYEKDTILEAPAEKPIGFLLLSSVSVESWDIGCVPGGENPDRNRRKFTALKQLNFSAALICAVPD